MDDESSSLKVKLYLLSSSDTEKKQDQRQLPVEYKKDRGLTVLMIYISVLTIGRNPYGKNIKPAKFSERLGKYKQFLEAEGINKDASIKHTGGGGAV